MRLRSEPEDAAVKKAVWTALTLLALAAGGYIALVAIPREATAAQRVAIEGNPADVGLTFEEFSVSPDDQPLSIVGWWMPADNARAVLVFIHGGGSNRTSSFFRAMDFYRAMVSQGIAVVAIDLRNHGESGSDARGLQFGRTEKYDARAAIDWARKRHPDLPLFAMGISMGGATLIHAAHEGPSLDGLILLDSLLDTADTFQQGAWVQTGLPPALFAPSAWAATQFFGLPAGDEEASERAAALKLPILAIQDPGDPVTRAQFSRELARRNPRVTLWEAPAIDPGHPQLAWKKRWGSHVSAFEFYPRETVARIVEFIDSQSG